VIGGVASTNWDMIIASVVKIRFSDPSGPWLETPNSTTRPTTTLGKPIPVLTTDLTNRLPGKSANPIRTATGTLNSVLSATAVRLTYSET